MKIFKADLHVHTLLSPCGELEMSPAEIVKKASLLGIDILGITDHNTTKHCALVKKLADRVGISILPGAEVTTKEEVHCLTFFRDFDVLALFQRFLEENLHSIKNDPTLFGYQVVIDEDENIIEEIEPLLISALSVSIEEVEAKVHSLGGIFIPAHINRNRYSILSQLGFIPKTLKVDALEISKMTTKEEFLKKNKSLAAYSFVQNSDAHNLETLGEITTLFQLEEPTFDEIKMALAGLNGRTVVSA